MFLRKAQAKEANACYQFIEDARRYHKSLGFEQWPPDYPTLHDIVEDIEKEQGHVFVDGNALAGYCCIIIGDEPAYHDLKGSWITSREYAVIHRLAFSAAFRGKGLSRQAFLLLKEYCGARGINAMRADTQKENAVMQHILIREGFSFCGLVTFDGSPKMAFEWDR